VRKSADGEVSRGDLWVRLDDRVSSQVNGCAFDWVGSEARSADSRLESLQTPRT
jgi:hypothetical protein